MVSEWWAANAAGLAMCAGFFFGWAVFGPSFQDVNAAERGADACTWASGKYVQQARASNRHAIAVCEGRDGHLFITDIP